MGDSTRNAIILKPGEGPVLQTLAKRLVLVDGTLSQGRITMAVITYPDNRPGPPEHRHASEDEAFFVLDGEFAFRISGATTRLGPGGFAYVPAGTAHTFAPAFPSGGQLLELFCPSDFEGYFEEWASLIAAGSNTQQAMEELQQKYGMEVVGPPIPAEER